MNVTRWDRAVQQLKPDFVLSQARLLTPADIAGSAPHVRAVCFDIDGTLTDYHAPAVPGEAVALLQALAAADYQTFVVSNCYGSRAKEVHRLFEPLVTAVFTPEDCLDPARPGQNPRRHGKPAPDMIVAAARRGGLTASELLMVGDQIFKDVVAARRAGAASLLVPRLGPSDHAGVRWLQRPLERVLRPLLGLPGGRAAWPSRLTSAR